MRDEQMRASDTVFPYTVLTLLGLTRGGTNTDVPELSRFFGIIIRMSFEAMEAHHTPHFHAYYQEDVAVYQIDPVEILADSLPKRQQRLVRSLGRTASA